MGWQAAAQVFTQLPVLLASLAQYARTRKIAEEWMEGTDPKLFHAPGWGSEGFEVAKPSDEGLKEFLQSYSGTKEQAPKVQRVKKQRKKVAYGNLLASSARGNK